MNAILEHLISGQSFFSGNILILLAVFCSFFEKRLVLEVPASKLSFLFRTKEKEDKVKIPIYKILVRLFLLFGLLLVILSSTPMSGVFFRMMGIAIFGLFIALQIGSKTLLLFTHILRGLVAFCSLYSMNNEMKYCNIPHLPRANYSHIFIIGDSISAGVAYKDEKTWADIIKERSGKKVVGLWGAGATIGDSLNRAGLVFGENLVIMEIGENDILRKTPVERFERDMEMLFKTLFRKGRTLVMLELPVPPLYTEYAQVQRRLAKKYGVYLIPKRFFAEVVIGADTTVDGFHLSSEGHEKLADIIWQTVKNTLDSNIDTK